MARIDTPKTELVWPGKYNEDGTLKQAPRVSLPFQVIETVNESRATRVARQSASMTLFDLYEGTEGDTFEAGWKNKLIWGDNLPVTSSLLSKFAGKIDLIYVDPPFATGADFSFTSDIGTSGVSIEKQQTILEERAYRDTWGSGRASYLEMISIRLSLLRDLLSPKGSLFFHCDYRLSHLLGLILDDIFGLGDRGSAKNQPGFRNEVVWMYGLGGSSPQCYPKKHDKLLWYSKSGQWFFDPPMVPATSQRMKGQLKKCPDYWDIPTINNMADERTGYPTQKPEQLLERIILAHTRQDDLVADFFCGSGTALAVAEKLGRRWIGCDLGRWGIHVTRKRLLDIEGCKPFELLNLGKYERQYWQGVTFGLKKDPASERALYEYLAFILKLYGAGPIAGMFHLHGKKGKAMVHVGAVDAPVTIAEVNAALDECVDLNRNELHVLGWEWEMGLAGPNEDGNQGSLMHDVARQKDVKLVLLQIPREVMDHREVDSGDVRFFELAYLQARIDHPDELTVRVALEDFVIPNTGLIPDDVRNKIDEWSDYIDYWAADWNFQNDTFMQGWVAYRTRQDRTLKLTSDSHTYEQRGRYRVLVKAIDIFGNDTSRAFDVEVGGP